MYFKDNGNHLAITKNWHQVFVCLKIWLFELNLFHIDLSYHFELVWFLSLRIILSISKYSKIYNKNEGNNIFLSLITFLMTFSMTKKSKCHTSEISSSATIDVFILTLVPILVCENCLSASNVRCRSAVRPYHGLGYGPGKHVSSHVCEHILVFGTSTSLLHA